MITSLATNPHTTYQPDATTLSLPTTPTNGPHSTGSSLISASPHQPIHRSLLLSRRFILLFSLLFRTVFYTSTFHTNTHSITKPSHLIMGPFKHQIIRHKDKFNNPTTPKPHEIITIMTFHNFNFDTHEGGPLYFLTLRAR